MGIPKVEFEEIQDIQGAEPAADGISAMVLSGIVLAGIGLNEPKAIFSLAQAEDLGIVDTLPEVAVAHREIADFYRNAPKGTELWISLLSNTTTVVDIVDKAQDYARKILLQSAGRIRYWGVNMDRDVAYTPVVTEGIDADVLDAIPLADALCVEMADDYYTPTTCILGSYGWTGPANVGTLKDLTTGNANHVGVTLHGVSGGLTAKVGYILGLKAALGVQRNIGVVQPEANITDDTYLTDGVSVPEDLFDVQDTMHDKGYIFPVKRQGQEGYYYANDPLATDPTESFNTWSRRAVINKVRRLAYDVHVKFINEDFIVDVDGNIADISLKQLQGSIEDVVNLNMVQVGELSAFRAVVEKGQDTVSTGSVTVKLESIPIGQYKEIIDQVSFTASQT